MDTLDTIYMYRDCSYDSLHDYHTMFVVINHGTTIMQTLYLMLALLINFHFHCANGVRTHDNVLIIWDFL